MRVVLQKVHDSLPIDLISLRNSFGFNEPDSFLLEVLRVAIGNIETRSGLSLVRKTWKVVHNNTSVYLPYGPILSISSIADSKGNEIVPLSKQRSNDNLVLNFLDGLGFITIIYEAGYEECNLPVCLNNSLISEFLKVYDLSVGKMKQGEKCALRKIEGTDYVCG